MGTSGELVASWKSSPYALPCDRALNCVPEIELFLDPCVIALATVLIFGCQAALNVPADVRNSTSVEKSVYMICPLGNSSRCPANEGVFAAFGGAGNALSRFPFHS